MRQGTAFAAARMIRLITCLKRTCFSLPRVLESEKEDEVESERTRANEAIATPD
jgi:hypothetical protein